MSHRRRGLRLPAALLANAVFSGVTGASLVVDLGGVAERLALPSALTALVGAGLLAFGAAAVVAALAVAQLAGLRAMLREVRPGLGAWRHEVAVDADAPPDALWCVVRDAGAIARFMPELATSEMRGGAVPAEGAVRACSDRAGARWAERITRLDDGDRSFDVRFLDHEPGYPFPARPMFGGWRVRPRPGGGSRVEVWWSLTPSVALLPWLVVALMGLRVDAGIARAVGRMDAAATGRRTLVGARTGVVPC